MGIMVYYTVYSLLWVMQDSYHIINRKTGNSSTYNQLTSKELPHWKLRERVSEGSGFRV